MTRPIKFRAWDKQQLRMSLPFSLGDSALFWFLDVDCPMPLEFATSKDRVVFQQFTGLADSTGKEIYEGDILEELIQNESAKQLGVCKQILGGWRIYSLPNSSNHWHGWKQKVIGNIFENPKLLN